MLDRLDKADARGVRRARVRAGGAAPRPDRLGAQGDRAPADGGAQGRGLRRHRARRGPSSRRRCRCSSCGAAGWSAGKGSSSTRSRTSTRPGARRQLLEQLYADAPRRGRAARGARPGAARRPGALRGVPHRGRGSADRSRRHRRAGSTSACRSGAPSASCSQTVTRNANEAFAQHKLRRASDHNARARALHGAPGGARRCPRRRCASSASTSRTCRAPRSSARWS